MSHLRRSFFDDEAEESGIDQDELDNEEGDGDDDGEEDSFIAPDGEPESEGGYPMNHELDDSNMSATMRLLQLQVPVHSASSSSSSSSSLPAPPVVPAQTPTPADVIAPQELERGTISLTRIAENEYDTAQKELFQAIMSELRNPDIVDENERIELICRLIDEPELPTTVEKLHELMTTRVMQPILRMIYTMCVSETELTMTSSDSLKMLLIQANGLLNWLHFRHIVMHPSQSLFAMNTTQILLDATPPSWSDVSDETNFVKRWCLIQAHKRRIRHFEQHVYVQYYLNNRIATHYWERKEEVHEYFQSLVNRGSVNAKLENAFTRNPEIFKKIQAPICTNQPLFPALNVVRGYVSFLNGMYNITNDTFITYEDMDMDVQRGRAEHIQRCRRSLQQFQQQRERLLTRQEREARGWEVMQDDGDDRGPSLAVLEAEIEDHSYTMQSLEEEAEKSRTKLQEFLGVEADARVTDTDGIVSSIFIPCRLEEYTGRWNGIDRRMPILHDRHVARQYRLTKQMEIPTVVDRFHNKDMEFLFDNTTMRFESILNTQQFDAVTKFWLMFFLGRTLHPLAPKEGGDNFQMVPVLFGLARTGKSLILNIMRHMFPPDKVVEIENYGEQVFGNEAEMGKWLSICSELEVGSNIDVATLKKKLEGTSIRVNKKNKLAENVVWSAHTIFASNNTLTSVFKNQHGSLSRRLAVFPFMTIPKDSDATLERQILEFELAYILRKCNICYQIGREIIFKHYDGDAWKAMPPVVCEQRDEMDMFSDEFFHFLMSHESLSFGPECVCRMEDLRDRFNEYCQSLPTLRNKRRIEWNPEVYGGAMQKLKCVIRRAYLPENVLQHERVMADARDYTRFEDVYVSSPGYTYEFDPEQRKRRAEEGDGAEGAEEEEGGREGRNTRRRVDDMVAVPGAGGGAAAAAAAAPRMVAGPRQVYEYVFGVSINPRDASRVIPSFIQWRLRPSEMHEEAIAFHILEAYVRNFMHEYYRTEQTTFTFDVDYLEQCLGYKGFTVYSDEEGVKYVCASIK